MRKLSNRLADEMEWVIMIVGLVLVVIAFLVPPQQVEPANIPEADAAEQRLEAPVERITFTTVCYGLGLSLIATALTSILLSDARAKRRDRRLGLERVIAKRYEVGPEFYSSLISGARHRVWVQGIGLTRFLTDNSATLVKLAKDGVDVRVLLLSDRHYLDLGDQISASLLATRALEENSNKIQKTPAGGSHESLLEFVNGLNGDSVPQFKVYFGTSASMVFLIDNILFYGPYLHRRDSGNTPTFQFGRGPVQEEVIRHFRMLWDDSRFTASLSKG